MDELEEDREEDDFGGWLHHPYTERQLKRFIGEAQQRLELLKKACSVTSDPQVAKAFSEYEMCRSMVRFLQGEAARKAQKNDDNSRSDQNSHRRKPTRAI